MLYTTFFLRGVENHLNYDNSKGLVTFIFLRLGYGEDDVYIHKYAENISSFSTLLYYLSMYHGSPLFFQTLM